jgi:DNA-binding CsgD family transcriptional regulator
MLTLLADEVGALGGIFAYQGVDSRSSFMVTGRLRDDITPVYLKHYTNNAYTQAFLRLMPGKVELANRLVDLGALRRSAFHADVLAPQAIENFLVVLHPALTGKGGTGGVTFALSRQQEEGIGPGAARLQRLAPHLSRAIELTLQLGQHRSGLWQIERILDAMPSAALLLNRNALIIRANRAADALLRRGDGVLAVRSDGLRLSAQSGAETRLLTSAIAQALAVARGEECDFRGPLSITRQSGRPPLVALVTPLPPPAFSLWEAVDGGARVLVQIVDPDEPVTTQAEALRSIAGLTAAEARVAAHVGNLRGLAAVAAKLGLSENTVKTHLKRVFEKTGARSQAELARLMASIPPRFGPESVLSAMKRI